MYHCQVTWLMALITVTLLIKIIFWLLQIDSSPILPQFLPLPIPTYESSNMGPSSQGLPSESTQLHRNAEHTTKHLPYIE
ncbi:hypothetical protein DFH29DRAFT_939413 [Suillus ampliporus]|nr:hypothetical protein DFH29DRAFT_939413 [Suillus ampliporus]